MDSTDSIDARLTDSQKKHINTIFSCIESGDTLTAKILADSLVRSSKGKSAPSEVMGELGLGYIAMADDDENRAFEHLEKARIGAEDLGGQGKKYSAMVYNAFGRYYLELISDVTSSVQSYSMALDFQEQVQADADVVARTLSNLACAYAAAKDTTGLIFARQAFEATMVSNDTATMVSSGLKAAYFHALKNETQSARKYLKRIKDAIDGNGNHRHKAELWLRYGNVYEAENNNDSALYCFDRAIELSDNSKPYEQVGMLLSKGNLLYKNGHPDKCIEILNKALRIAGRKKIIYQTSEIFGRIADCHNSLGNYWQTTRMMLICKNFEDSIHSSSRERALNMLRIRDEVLLHQIIIQKQRTALEREERNAIIIMSVCVLLFITVGLITYFYFKKRRLFSIIIKQNREYEKRQRELSEYICELQTADEDNVSGMMPGNKISNIMRSLDELLSREDVLTDPNLTLNSVAERLGTNRTYLSQAVKEATGESFPTLIRTRRVKYALELMARSDKDISTKDICRLSGFSSLSSFHTAIKAETGMTPNTYRNELNRQK